MIQKNRILKVKVKFYLSWTFFFSSYFIWIICMSYNLIFICEWNKEQEGVEWKRKEKKKGNFILPNIVLDLNSALFDFLAFFFLLWHIALLLPTLWTSSYTNDWVNGRRKDIFTYSYEEEEKDQFPYSFSNYYCLCHENLISRNGHFRTCSYASLDICSVCWI